MPHMRQEFVAGFEPGHPRRGRALCRCASWHRLGYIFAARPRLPHRGDPLGRAALRRRLAQNQPALLLARTSSAICTSSMRQGRRRAEAGATPAQVALAWLLAQGADLAPIPGTKRVTRVEENTAANRVELSSGRSNGSATSRRRPIREIWPSSTGDHDRGRESEAI